MSLNVAFYDVARRVLVEHEQVPWDRSLAPLAAIQMSELFQSGNHSLPSSCWVVWNDPDDMSIFQLDDSDGFQDGFLDGVHACVSSFVFLNSGPAGVFRA